MSLQSGAGRVESGPSYRRDHKGSVFSGLVLTSLTYLNIGVVTSKRGPGGQQEGRRLSQSDLHRSKDGKGDRVWQTLHTKPQSE